MREPEAPYEIRAPHALNQREVYLQSLEELAKPLPAIPLPDWPQFTRLTGGFREREYTILCGSTGSGKTTWLANVSAQLLKQEVRHFVMSIETGHTDFMKRVISVLEGRDVNTGDPVSAEELARIHSRQARYLERDTVEFSLYDDRIHLEQLKADIDHMVHMRGCKLVMIDNLNYLLQPTRAQDAVFEMDRVTHDLVAFTKQTPVHVIMVMHPRKSAGDCRIRTEEEIKGSSTATQEAFNIFLWNRPTAEDIEDGKRSVYDREFTFRKVRRRGVAVPKTIVFGSVGTRYLERGVL